MVVAVREVAAVLHRRDRAADDAHVRVPAREGVAPTADSLPVLLAGQRLVHDPLLTEAPLRAAVGEGPARGGPGGVPVRLALEQVLRVVTSGRSREGLAPIL